MLNWTDLGAAMAVCKRWAEVFLVILISNLMVWVITFIFITLRLAFSTGQSILFT